MTKQDNGNMSTIMTALAWAAAMIFVGFYFNDMLSTQQNPNQALETQYTQDRIREVTLKRNRYGHYVTNGKINGQDVVFMLDTGATGVAVPSHIAEKIGLERGRSFRVHTANGAATAYTTSPVRVSVGDIQLEKVIAHLSPGLAGDEILLGMSFLKHIEFTQRGDILILRQAF